jgi:hypothetical protein
MSFLLISTTDCSVYLIWKHDSLQVWPIDRKCLFFLSTWSYLRYVQRSVYAPFSDLYNMQDLWDRCLFFWCASL